MGAGLMTGGSRSTAAAATASRVSRTEEAEMVICGEMNVSGAASTGVGTASGGSKPRTRCKLRLVAVPAAAGGKSVISTSPVDDALAEAAGAAAARAAPEVAGMTTAGGET
jgi:hypothetical protein